jgi:hypothetical protein
LNPLGQLQIKKFDASKQVPPFKQGFDEHFLLLSAFVIFLSLTHLP